MKTIISDTGSLCQTAAETVGKLLREKKDAVIAFSLDEGYDAMFMLLREKCSAGELDFSEARILSTAEFISDGIIGRRLKKELLSGLNVKRENVFLLCENNCDLYDGLIETLGGIDLLILSVGGNARIAFNDCGTPFSSLTHIRALTPSVKEDMAWLKEDGKELPDSAVTVGIKTITQAKHILLPAFGEEKSESVYKMLYGRNDPSTPAAFLQIPMNVTVLLDRGAASKL